MLDHLKLSYCKWRIMEGWKRELGGGARLVTSGPHQDGGHQDTSES